MASLIKEVHPHAKIYLVDLGKTLLFQCHYCFKAHPKSNHHLVTRDSGAIDGFLETDFVYCPAEHLSRLDPVMFNWAININSMQEMNTETVQNYFKFLRMHMAKDHLFYCCNREEKIMPEGEISRFLSYPWHKDDLHLVDEACPWQKCILSRRSLEKGPKIFNRRVPFINYFDGDIRHRLSVFQDSRQEA